VGGPFHFTLALGGLNFDFGGVGIGVLNNYPFPVGDQYQVLYFVNPTDDNPTGIQLSTKRVLDGCRSSCRNNGGSANPQISAGTHTGDNTCGSAPCP